jgi:circadian clock protein KaiC
MQTSLLSQEPIDGLGAAAGSAPHCGIGEMRVGIMTSDTQLLSTGIADLDHLLGGGIPARQILLVAGHPGSGKTILAGQIGFAAAGRGEPVVLATAASEPHSKLIESLQGFSFFRRDLLAREIVLLSMYPWLRKGVRETREMLLSSIRERRVRLLVIDGLRSLHDVWRDETSIREFLGEVGVGLASSDCTGVFTLECAPDRILETAEAATVDGVLTLDFTASVMHRLRRIEVVKVRGRHHLAGEHVARLGGSGFRIVPRIDALPPPSGAPARREGRALFGVSALDAWLGGGLPGGGSTLIAGAPGTGKTLLASAFARAGAAAGEPTLVVSLEEDAEAVLFRMRALGLELTPGRMLSVWSPSLIGLEPDEIAGELLERAEALSARRVVVDGVDVLQQIISPAGRRLEFDVALLQHLRAGGRDALFTSDLMDASTAPLARGVDNLFELRGERRGGQVQRELWAVKVRSAASPGDPWRFNISASSGLLPEAVTR